MISVFLKDLWEEGKVLVKHEFVQEFSEEEKVKTIVLLRKYYEQDALNQAFIVPEFSESAVWWSLQYFFYVVQFTCIRSFTEEQVLEILKDFQGEDTVETIYSVDLIFRQLPNILDLAKGLAPDDVLVKCIHQQIEKWCLSSVGISSKNHIHESLILGNKALTTLYVDRIIDKKDKKRLENPLIQEQVFIALGDYKEEFWREL